LLIKVGWKPTDFPTWGDCEDLMRYGHGWQWKRRFSGLAFRISFMVFAAALFTSLVITSVSIRSIGTFLRGEIDRKFPELLESASDRLDFWYEQREGDLTAFARSRVLLEGLITRGEMTRKDISWYLSFVLERFPQYSALLLLDAEGEELLRAGEAPELDLSLHASLAGVERTGVSRLRYVEGRRIQLVSAPVENPRGERIATLHAVLHLETLEPLLSQPESARSTTLQLIDHTGRALGEDPALPPRGVPVDAVEKGVAPEIVITENAAGERIVASAVSLPHLGWTLLAVEEYDAAFAPIHASVRRTLVINLLTVLLSSAGAFVFAAWRVRPILALSEGARRISEGETAVEVPDSGSGDEIQILAQSFNQMSARLHESRLELESRNQELQRANQALEQLSITDSLTRLHNHRFFQDQFAREAKRVDRTGSPLCLALIDIDDFKSLNDQLGHAAGDTVLERVAAVMSGVLRETDTLCRYGGEEFALLTPQTDLSGAISGAEKIRGAVAESEYGVVGPDGPARITVSIGVAEFARSTGHTFNQADRALYDAKAAGKDCVVAASLSG
jgi:diguanylate cyclase (GGDEF)-like protein